MPDSILKIPGEKLLGDSYLSDFNDEFWQIRDHGFWKLERLQEFREPQDTSWVAFACGRWEEALSIIERRRPELEEYYRHIAESGFSTRRVRIVEQPISDYMIWELHLLRLRHELGGSCRVLNAAQIEEYERPGILPELVILGDRVACELLYHVDGLQEGGVRGNDPRIIAERREFIETLYEVGEDLERYFQREIVQLTPRGATRKNGQ